jgi:hypothetical protein
MQSYTSIFVAALAALSSLPTFAQAQTSGTITCNNGGPNNIQTSAIRDLISALDSNSIVGLSDPINLVDQFKAEATHLAHAEITIGSSLRVVLQNDNVFQSTHVTFATLANALEEVLEVCCGSFPMCISGVSRVTGDDGAGVALFVNNINNDPIFG